MQKEVTNKGDSRSGYMAKINDSTEFQCLYWLSESCDGFTERSPRDHRRVEEGEKKERACIERGNIEIKYAVTDIFLIFATSFNDGNWHITY